MKAVFYIFIFYNFKNAKIYSRLVKFTDLLSEQVSEVSDTKINIGQTRFLMVSRKVSEEVSGKNLIHSIPKIRILKKTVYFKTRNFERGVCVKKYE